jgi:hypothetical protein
MSRWFTSAGLDLASTDVDVPGWVADFRRRREIVADEATGA